MKVEQDVIPDLTGTLTIAGENYSLVNGDGDFVSKPTVDFTLYSDIYTFLKLITAKFILFLRLVTTSLNGAQVR